MVTRCVIRKLSRRSGFIAALAVAVLAAQAVTVSHELDAADHEPGQSCEVCLAASVLGGANVAAVSLPAAVATARAVDTACRPLPLSCVPRDFRARSPPFAS
jgi:hypothetical protein